MIKLISVFVLIALWLSGCSPQTPMVENADMTYRQISMDEAIDIIEKETDYIILDVRTAEEYAQGHIPEAILLPLADIGNEDPELLPDKEQMILVYCRSGNRSKVASEKLAELGYSNVFEFGGINSWPGEVETD